MQASLIQAYSTHILTYGERPASVQAFARANGLDVSAILAEFSSFEAIENHIFYTLFEEVITQLEMDEDYLQYDVGTKLLSVDYTWLEILSRNRSLVTFIDMKARTSVGIPAYLAAIKDSFLDLADRILDQGRETGEIADRWVVSRYYKNLIWGHAQFIFNYWLHDMSRSFERSDAAVEKSLRLVIELIRPNVFDAGVDLARFLLQRPSGEEDSQKKVL